MTVTFALSLETANWGIGTVYL